MINWLIVLISLVFGSLVGGIGVYLFVRHLPKEQVRKLNEQIIQQEQLRLKELQSEQKEIEFIIVSLKNQQNEVQNSLTILENQAKTSAEIFYNQSMELARAQLERSLEQAGAQYQQDEEVYQEHYLQLLKECALEYAQKEEELKNKFSVLQNKLDDISTKVTAAVEAAKREEEKRNQENFYRLILTEEDVKEIKCLRSVEPFLRDREALNKVIWKVYYEKPYTDLIGRVIGSKVKTGIYKITNLENQMCYVGQAVNIADRWRQHIKRGIGAEAPTRNKLYPAMLSLGVENFSFEVIEECTRDKLDEREDYWQEFFHAKEFGYSIK